MASPEEELMRSYERAMDTMNGLKSIIEEQKKTIARLEDELSKRRKIGKDDVVITFNEGDDSPILLMDGEVYITQRLTFDI